MSNFISEAEFASLCDRAWLSNKDGGDIASAAWGILYHLRERSGSDDPGTGVVASREEPIDHAYVREIANILHNNRVSFDYLKYLNELRQKFNELQK